MNIFNNFSYRLFSVITILFYCASFGFAQADYSVVDIGTEPLIDEQTDPYVEKVEPVVWDPDVYEELAEEGYTSTVSIETKILCKEGYYLSHCGGIKVGTNWLKGIQGNTTTPDYYSYGLPDSDTTNIANLRKFFAGLEPINYTKKDRQTETVSPSEYKPNRNEILTTFCTKNDELLNIECAKCPNNAKIPRSIVGKDNTSGKIIKSSWQVHTISDCYMDKFSDHTGTYIYVATAAANSATAGKKCYYSNDVEGDELISE